VQNLAEILIVERLAIMKQSYFTPNNNRLLHDNHRLLLENRRLLHSNRRLLDANRHLLQRTTNGVK
jgi:hypothetical protein